MKNRNILLGAVLLSAIVSASTIFAMKATGYIAPAPSSQLSMTDSVDPAPQHGLVRVSASAGVPTDFTQAAESTINGVVSIKNYVNINHNRQNYNQRRNDFFSDPFFEYFFGSPRSRQQEEPDSQAEDSTPNEQQQGLGSGVIITPDGYIVTNNHVIKGADRLEVTMNDNRTYDAIVVGNDESTDLALIKIDASDLPAIPVGDSDALKVGEWVLAVGNPFGLTSTVTSGIVSAKARSISDATHTPSMGVESYIQTDAAVNPGNSGGALVNLKGELVGINTAIYSQTGNYAGHSFAIPTAIVNKVVGDLKRYGAVQRAFLGITFRPLDAKFAKEKNLNLNEGIYVVEVQKGTAASEAGLKPGDVIVRFGGINVATDAQFRGMVNRFSPGDEVPMSYVRDGHRYDITIKLLNSAGSTSITRAGDIQELGCTFEALTAEQLHELNLRNGVKVAKLSAGLMKDAGVRQGYIITSINQTAVRSAKDVEALYKAAMKSDIKVLFINGLYEGGKRTAYAVNLEE